MKLTHFYLISITFVIFAVVTPVFIATLDIDQRQQHRLGWQTHGAFWTLLEDNGLTLWFEGMGTSSARLRSQPGYVSIERHLRRCSEIQLRETWESKQLTKAHFVGNWLTTRKKKEDEQNCACVFSFWMTPSQSHSMISDHLRIWIRCQWKGGGGVGRGHDARN